MLRYDKHWLLHTDNVFFKEKQKPRPAGIGLLKSSIIPCLGTKMVPEKFPDSSQIVPQKFPQKDSELLPYFLYA
jgi:hypothetical protein